MNTPINSTKRTDLMKVDPRNISIKEGFNVRFDYGNLDELKKSIVEVGLKMPLRGYVDPENKEKFILTDGHRRLKAIKAALDEGVDIARVPFMKEDKKYNEEQRTFDLIICNDGKKLDSLEEAEVVARLVKFGYSAKEIASKTGRSEPHVYNMIRLAGIDKKIKNYIQEGRVTSGAVLQLILKNKDKEKHLEIVEEALEEAKSKATESVKTKPDTKNKDVDTDGGEGEHWSAPENNDGEVEVQVPKVRPKDLKGVGAVNHLKVLKDALAIAKENGDETFSYRVLANIVGKLEKKATAEEIAQALK